jgi:hypothetical protein
MNTEVLCNIFIEFGTSMEPLRLIKTCSNETYSKVRLSKKKTTWCITTQNGLKQGGALLLRLFNFALQYATSKV